MTKESFPDPEEFTGKYEKSGKVGGMLINNFYKAIESILPNDIDSIFEAGCGPGYSTEKIAPLRPDAKFIASDIDPELVQMANERNTDIEFKVDSIYDLHELDNSHDLVIALETLEHLDDPDAALAELARVTKKYALISVPREPIWRALNMARGAYLKDLGNTPGHLNHWSTRSFKKFVEQYFTIEEVKTPLPWTIILAKKKDVE